MAEYVFKGDWENTNDFRLDSDGTALDLSSVTQIDANIAGVDIVSTNQADDLIRWSQVGFVTGEIRCQFGSAPGLMPGAWPCYFIVYDPVNVDGIVFGPMTLTVVQLP